MTGRTFDLPDLGEGLHEAEIVAWHVSAGDHVVSDQPLVSVETDKAVVEVPSPCSGRIESLHGEPGDIVEVGDPLVVFSDAEAEDAGAIVGEVSRDATPARPRQATASAADRPQAESANSDKSAGRAESAGETGSTRGAVSAASAGRTRASSSADRGIAAAPAVRRLAAALGVDLADVTGTGVGGSVTRFDVEAAASSLGGAGRVEPVRGVRRAMLRNMVRAGREVVHATVTDEADIEAWSDGEDITARLIRAVVAGCRASPSLNAWFDAGNETRTVHERIDLGMAVETEDGLFAPVVRDVGARDRADLRREIDTLKRAIAARSLERDALVGQTITLSNFGMFGGRFADLVVVPPQVAILGAGRADRRPVAAAGGLTAHRLLPLSLSFDHRVVTGVEATRFLGAAIADLEKPG